MILERVQLESWGCLRWPVELVLHPRVNLVHAPNESGKSTLVAAIRHALLEPATVNVEAYRPWGSEVVPKAAVEFRNTAGRWRVEKVFARRSARARLLKEQKGFWVPLEEDPNSVYFRVLELITGNSADQPRSGRRRSGEQSARHGVIYVLWRDQGKPPLEGLDLPGVAERDLAEAVGLFVLSDRDRRLIETVQSKVSQYFTPVRRDESGELAAAKRKLEAARQTFQGFQERIELLRDWEKQALDTADLLSEKRALLREAIEGQHKAEVAFAEAEKLAKQLEEAQKRLHDVTRSWADWNDKVNDLAAAREARDRAMNLASTQREALRTGQEQADALRKQLTDLQKTISELERPARQATEAAKFARARLDLARALAEHDEIEGRLRRAQPFENEIERASEELKTFHVPEDEELAQLNRLMRELDIEEAKLSAARVRVTFSAEQNLHAEISVDGHLEEQELPAGRSFTWEPLEEAFIRLSGLGSFHIERALETSLAQQRTKVNQLRKKIEEQLSTWGASGVEELERRAERARICKARLQEAETALRSLLPEGRREVEQRLALIETRLRSIRQQNPELEQDEPNLDQAEAEERRAAEAASLHAQVLEERRKQMDKLQTELAQCTSELSDLEAAVRETEREVHHYEGRIELLQSDGLADEERLAQLAKLESEKTRTEEEVRRLAAGVVGLDDARQALDLQLQQVKKLESDCQELERQLIAARTRAEAMSEEGLYSKLIRAEEEVESAASEYQFLREKAEALDLLARVLTEERDRQRSELFRPVEERVSRYWGRVSGGRYKAVKVEGGLRPSAVVPDDVSDVTPSPDSLSGGAQEQLGVLIRLALAETLATADPDEGQTLILDEPLSYSDPGRRERVNELLSQPVPGLQVIVLANDRRDYTSLRCDAEHDLAFLVDAAREAAATRDW